MLVGDGRDRFQVRDIESGIAHCLAEERFGLLGDGSLEIRRLVRIDQFDLDA